MDRASGQIRLTLPRDGTLSLREYIYRKRTKQRAEEQVSHDRSKPGRRVEILYGRLLEQHVTTGAETLYGSVCGSRNGLLAGLHHPAG